MSNQRVRPLRPNDLEAMDAVLMSAFGVSVSFRAGLERHFAIQPDGWLVAEADETPAGMIGAVRFGTVAYIGMMGVAPEFQGRGIGAQLMEALLADMEHHGCTTLLLDATPMGERLYRRFGFVDDGILYDMRRTPVVADADWSEVAPQLGIERIVAIHREASRSDRYGVTPPLEIEGRAAIHHEASRNDHYGVTPPLEIEGRAAIDREASRSDRSEVARQLGVDRIGPLNSEPSAVDRSRAQPQLDLEQIAAIDREAFGADRRTVLARLLSEPGATAFSFEDAGYVIGQSRVIGPVIARSADVAECLLALIEPSPAHRMMLPAENEAGLPLLRRHGFEIHQDVKHMRRGAPVARNRKIIFGQASFALG